MNRISKVIAIVALIEVSIGLSTIAGLITSVIINMSTKPLNVFAFVLITAGISTVIGIGLFRHYEWARIYLVFFSGYIIIIKILIFTHLMHFNGEMITAIPTSLKNVASVFYHTFAMIFFTHESVKKCFLDDR